MTEYDDVRKPQTILSVEYAKNIKKQRVPCSVLCRSPAPPMSTAMAFEPTFKAK